MPALPALPVRRASVCLFCAWAPQRLLPYVHTARRSALSFKRPADWQSKREPHHLGRVSFNPVDRTFHVQPAHEAVREKLDILQTEFREPEFLASLHLTQDEFDREWLSFQRSINLWIKTAASDLVTLVNDARRGRQALERRLRYLFYAQIFGGRFTKAELANQKEVADLRYPAEWYPATREIPRNVHLHVGPTNSGKTYHALKRLEEADRGIYLGPLRLLAHEVYTRLNAKGKACALVTGEEQRLPDGETNMWSCTVEMAPLNAKLDVAVIDEIQMINHEDRGWAWTQAFLGVQAKEVHLCGEARTVPLIRELCALVGDKVHVHEYKRLTKLEVAPRSLRGKLGKVLEKGDCIVSFSVLGIHALRREIEGRTGKKCAIVYGSLPPETRAQQARLFNDPDNDYDFLVASDAIGMGLNLSIKRVIFESTVKSNGSSLVPLKISEIKQIAGRAGRFKTAQQAIDQGSEQVATPASPIVGFATTLEQVDHPHLVRAMEREPEPITTAGLFPPSITVERFASYFPPGTPFSYIMLRLHEISVIHPRFHLCALKDQLAIADTIHLVKNLSITDRITICAAPTNMRDAGEKNFLFALAECIADNKSGHLLDLPHIPLEILDQKPSPDRDYLKQLEQLHKMIVAYLWLSFRFPNVFTTRSLANHTKQLVEDAIERTLSEFSFTPKARGAIRRKREEALRNLGEDANTSIRSEPPSNPSVAPALTDVLNDSEVLERTQHLSRQAQDSINGRSTAEITFGTN